MERIGCSQMGERSISPTADLKYCQILCALCVQGYDGKLRVTDIKLGG